MGARERLASPPSPQGTFRHEFTFATMSDGVKIALAVGYPKDFDPADRHFVFYDVDDPEVEIRRRPAKRLDVTDLTGLAEWPVGLGIQQLPLPFFIPEGVDC